MLSREPMRRLTNALEIASYMNTDYNNEFTKDYAIGDTVSIPLPIQYMGNDDNTLAYTPEPIINRHIDVVINKVAKVHFEWDSIERALKMPRSEEEIQDRIIQPAVDRIKQKIENDCANWIADNTPNVVGTLGTNPTTTSVDALYGAAGQRMAEISAPTTGGWGMFLNPGLARAVRASVQTQMNPPDALKAMWKTGSIGMINNFDTYQTLSLPSHTAGTWAGVVEMLAANQSGSVLSLTATTGDTIKRGDKVNIAGVYEFNSVAQRSTGTLKQFTVINANTVTAAASAASITVSPAIVGPGSPYQNVDALPAAGADLTLFPGTTSPNGKSGTVGFAIGKYAFALVSVPLPNPNYGAGNGINSQMSSRSRDPNSGISISFIRAFDPVLRKWINRLECIYGLANLYNDHDAVAIVGA
jgi:hypothetical protein